MKPELLLGCHDAGCGCPECEPDDDGPSQRELDDADYDDRVRIARESWSW